MREIFDGYLCECEACSASEILGYCPCHDCDHLISIEDFCFSQIT